jgi:hypothetical protein
MAIAAWPGTTASTIVLRLNSVANIHGLTWALPKENRKKA